MTREQFLDKIYDVLSKYNFKYSNYPEDNNIRISYSLYACNLYPMGSLTLEGNMKHLNLYYSTASLQVYPNGNNSFPVEIIKHKVHKFDEFDYDALDTWAKHQLDLLNLYNKTYKECMIKSKLTNMNNDFE